eukprot:GILI01030428.1.p1 GENE.GILI01030428.1~~GILI01030428.1.p1  ORF type:complete len:293 (+),score=38.23 GILI01030428.1:80-880(+)
MASLTAKDVFFSLVESQLNRFRSVPSESLLCSRMGWENQLERLQALLSSIPTQYGQRFSAEELQSCVESYSQSCSMNIDSAPKAPANGSTEAAVNAFCKQVEISYDTVGTLRRHSLIVVNGCPFCIFNVTVPKANNGRHSTYFLTGAALHLDGSFGPVFQHTLNLPDTPAIVPTPICQRISSCDVLDMSGPRADGTLIASVLRSTDDAVVEVRVPNTVLGAALFALWKEEGEQGNSVQVNLMSLMGNTFIESLCIEGVAPFSFLVI